MKLTNVIEVVFGSSGRTAILRRLAKAPQPLSGRQIAELTGLTHRGAIQALAGLVETGVVRQRQVGRAHQYSLREDNVAVNQIILPALASEEHLLDLLKEELAKTFSAHALSLILFGSFARGDADSKSDIDVLVVTSDAKKKMAIDQLAQAELGHFNDKFHALLSCYSLTLDELKRKRRLAFLKQAEQEGILLYGKNLEELGKRYA